MSEEGFGTDARVITVGAHRAVLTLADGEVRIDLTDSGDAGTVGGDDEWRKLLADLVPGLDLTPLPTVEPVINLEDSRLVVRWPAPANTTLTYGPVSMVIGAASELIVEIGTASRILMVGAASIEASSQLSWLDSGTEFLEVYPAEGDALTFLSANAFYDPAPTPDDPATILEFDPLGNDAPMFLRGADISIVSSNTVTPLPILQNDAPHQRLRVTSVNAHGDDAIAVGLETVISRFQPPLLLTTVQKLDALHMGLAIAHTDGIALRGSATGASFAFPTDPDSDTGGLRWTVEREDGATEEPLFVLTTRDADHRIVLDQGARAKLEYWGISRDPIRFTVDRFEITKKGIVADARVLDDPVRLNGVDTAFRFTDGLIQIRDGQIADFTLLGSGPLPPALVGDGNAGISIRFSDTGSGVVPVGAGAALTEDQPLFSPNVLFEYAVDALGLSFVGDGSAHHFYFTMSANASFSPGPSYPASNLLAQLDVATIGLVDAPLAGDASVLAKHINFVVELAEPTSFAVLGCFDMQIQAVGFHPSYYPFDGDAGLELSGQVKFADGEGDKALGVDSRHRLVLGAPAPNTFVPRVHFVELAIVIEKGDAFKLDVVVNFYDDEDRAGFDGEGTLEIKGLPGLAVAVGFMRVRRPVDDEWLRAWFIAANVSKLTLRVPVLEFYLREIGLGFGYRYTLASIAAADETDDVGELLARLRELSRSQGDLATRDAWAVSLEEPEADPRWTIALRALFSQSASPSSTPIRWNEAAEKNVPSAFLFDVVAAIRSDLVFFIAARAWINTNYYDYVMDEDDAIRSKPLFTGFALLEPRKQRFLAQIASNPEGHLGSRPPLPDFIEGAIRNGQFAATVLIEPNLFHAELGWPNQLRWGMNFGPLTAQVRAGLIYRIAQRGNTTDLVLGISYMARASMRFSAGISIGIAGVDLVASADGTFGARLIAAAQLGGGQNAMQIYGAVGVDIRIRIELRVWIRFLFITKTWTFAMEMQFTASLEFGVLVDGSTTAGIRGRGTLRIRVLGKSFEVRARIESGASRVDAARRATERYLNIGLEADEEATRATPGTGPAPLSAGRPAVAAAAVVRDVAAVRTDADMESAVGHARIAGPLEDAEPPVTEPSEPALHTPRYDVYVIRPANGDDPAYALLYPAGDMGFVPVPPASGTKLDFRLDVPAGLDGLERWDPGTGDSGDFVNAGPGRHEWAAPWDTVIVSVGDAEDPPDDASDVTLGGYVDLAFVDGQDPDPLDVGETLTDGRVKAPTESAYESAVRGAFEQFRSSPLFKPDPNSTYEQALSNALNPETSIYGEQPADDGIAGPVEGARQFRGIAVHNMVADLRAYVDGDPDFVPEKSPAFLLGLVIRADGSSQWLTDEGAARPAVGQRMGPSGEPSEPQAVRVFNRADHDFGSRPPRLEEFKTFTDATTVAFAWDLAWDGVQDGSDPRDEPEHHLAHYEVTRRTLGDGTEQMTTTVKPADVLEGGRPDEEFSVRALRPRFQFVDHFGHETDDEIAALPASGKSYLYTITPVDLNESRGRPVTVVATRYPNEPPPVPVDTEITVSYAVDADSFAPIRSEQPPVTTPAGIRARWTRPTVPAGAPLVAVEKFHLVFRRLETMAIGSYGLDAVTSGDMPSSNARVRPDDVVLEIDPGDPDSTGRYETTISLIDLQNAGVLPEEQWRPEAWRVFIQTVSAAKVPSALVPVRVLLRFEADDGGEDRHPPHLEWISGPLDLPVVAARDGSARPITVHVPQPDPDAGEFGVSYLPHPAERRAVQVRWNQAPSVRDDVPTYATALGAGYQLFRLDVDAHGAATFQDPVELQAALQRLDEIRLQPPDELGLVPSTTLTPSEWEAWYPGGDTARDWTSHRLQWPAVPEDPGQGRTGPIRGQFDATPTFLHPVLRWIIAVIGAASRSDAPPDPDAAPAYVVNVQAGRPLTAEDLDELINVTAPSTDPYGWALLQHLGMSVALSVRDTSTDEIVKGDALYTIVQSAINVVVEMQVAGADHIVTELLFRPDASVGAGPAPADPDQLLALTQISLRPRVVAVPELETEPTRLATLIESETRGLVGNAERLGFGPDIAALADDEPERYEIWLSRFLMTGADVGSGGGSIVATAYPRPSAPAIVSPDSSGRVTYLDLITDGWAHAYRYYLHPYGRYDRLWSSLAGSPVFDFTGALGRMRRPVDPPAVDPVAGGIDAVLERTAPIAAPVIISSTRIDPLAAEGATSEPGQTWEVALAQHPEQALSERNRTLFKLLDYRQIAFTVLRRFVPDADFLEAVDIDAIDPVPPVEQEPPRSTALEHVRMGALSSYEAATLALPERVGGFGVGSLVVQIDHLPFFYEHRLVAVAQTSQRVSEPATTTHSEFDYRSPVMGPDSDLSDVSLARMWALTRGNQTERQVTLPLARLWDALTDAQRRRWPGEAPVADARRPSSVPDAEVGYDVLYAVNGTVAIVARVNFDRTDNPEGPDPSWKAASVGEQFAVEQVGRVRSGPDTNTRDRWVVFALGPSASAAGHPPTRVPVSSARPVFEEGGLTLEVAPSDAWNVALYGVEPIDLEDITVVPALAPALQRVASLAGADELLTATFDPTRPLSALPELVGEIDDTSYLAFAWTLPPTDEAVERMTEALSSLDAPEAIAEPLRRLGARLTQMQEPITVEVGLSLEEVFPADSLDRPGDDEVVWSGEPSLLRDRNAISDRLERAAPEVQAAGRELLVQIEGLPAEFVELWTRDSLEADLQGDDAESLIDRFAGAPPEVLDVAVRLLGGSDHPLSERLAEVMRESPGDSITVTHHGVRTRPTPSDIAATTSGNLTLADGVLTWQGFGNDDHLQSMRSLVGDPDFMVAVEQIVDVLEETHIPPVRVQVGAAVPVAVGLLGTPAGERIVVSPFVYRQDGFMDMSLAAEFGSEAAPADRAAIDLLYRRALQHDLAGGSLQIRARRGSAPPSRREDIRIPNVSPVGGDTDG